MMDFMGLDRWGFLMGWVFIWDRIALRFVDGVGGFLFEIGSLGISDGVGGFLFEIDRLALC
jgi:hypothetical protein